MVGGGRSNFLRVLRNSVVNRMLAQLLLLFLLFVSAVLVQRLLALGKLGKLSEAYHRRYGNIDAFEAKQQRVKPLEISISIPSFPQKAKFFKVLELVPTNEQGEALTRGAAYETWLQSARMALLERAMEAVLAYRSCETMYLDTFCKFSQKLASERSWKQANQTRDTLQKELDEIRVWAGNLYTGWENGVIQQAAAEVDKHLQAQRQQQQQQQQGSGGGGGGE